MLLKCINLFLTFLIIEAVFGQDFRLDSYIVNTPLPYLSKHSYYDRTEKNITLRNCTLEKISTEAFKNVKTYKLYITDNPLKALKRRMFSLLMVDELYLDNNQISDIEPGTFHQVYPIYEDSLQILSLSNNKLEMVKRGVFSGTNFKKILLNSNKIDFIEFAAFENMPYLLALHLGDNSIQRINVGVFNNYPNPLMLRLSNNQMYLIHPRAFENTTLLSLDLQDNNLGDLKKDYFVNALIGWYFI